MRATLVRQQTLQIAQLILDFNVERGSTPLTI